MSQQTHFFFALKIPAEIKLIMKDHCEKLKLMLPFSRWVHHEDLHITLAFLGHAPAEKLNLASAKVSEELSEIREFPMSIHNLGIFGREESPRIFWADTLHSQELQLVRKKVFTACEKAGFQLETRPFRPHITLARKWAGETPFQKNHLEQWSQIQPEPLKFIAKEVVLYQTHLEKSPKYEEKKIFLL